MPEFGPKVRPAKAKPSRYDPHDGYAARKRRQSPDWPEERDRLAREFLENEPD